MTTQEPHVPIQPQDRDRFHAWYDQLKLDERQEVDYVTRELKGDFATAYLAVHLRRIGDRMLALETRSPLRVGLRDIVTSTGAVLAFLGLTHSNVNIPK